MLHVLRIEGSVSYPSLLNAPPAAFAALSPRCSGSPSSKSWAAAAATNLWSDRSSRPASAVAERWTAVSIHAFPPSLRDLRGQTIPHCEGGCSWRSRSLSVLLVQKLQDLHHTMILLSCLMHTWLIWLSSNSNCSLWTLIWVGLIVTSSSPSCITYMNCTRRFKESCNLTALFIFTNSFKKHLQ